MVVMILTLKLKKSRHLFIRKRIVLEKYTTLKALLKESEACGPGRQKNAKRALIKHKHFDSEIFFLKFLKLPHSLIRNKTLVHATNTISPINKFALIYLIDDSMKVFQYSNSKNQ
ncbi:hypothetical protein BpHYR1_010903 [Brachionus plicatilis]|uniref:Uncharacterized protein n=1 Tax=Brachionus plicatilis TaxID=10195 RepID=A0A3M7Q8M6_BRAPC|nr:hypothetical protein BpHYR1_010903 [Brachionus plicatilis]